MLDPYLTLKRVIAFGPCHSAETIRAWYPGKKRVRLSTVLKDDRISHADRVWLAVRVLPRAVVDRCLEVVVGRAIRRAVGTSGRPAWEAWAERWLSGADRTRAAVGAAEASRASFAACWAAAAAWLSATARTRAAAAASAEAAAAAASAEAAGAAWASEEAAWEAERDQQIADLLEIIKTYKETRHA